jgi:hypothetical protein
MKEIANKICWYLFLIYMTFIVLYGLYAMAKGIQDSSMRVLSPTGGRADFYLDFARDYAPVENPL